MKKIFQIQVILILLNLSSDLFAQGLTIGVVSGPILSKPYTNYKTDDYVAILSSMTSFAVNGHIGYQSGRLIGFSCEPGYIRKGGNTDESLGWRPDRIVYNYFNTTLLIDFNIFKGFALSIGPELAKMLKATEINNDEKSNITDEINKKFEFSGVIGLHYSPIKSFDIGLRYSRAFTQSNRAIVVNSNGFLLGDAAEFNQYFQLFLRYKITMNRNKK